AAVASATCVAEAVGEVVSGRAANAFCLVVAPGRHAASSGAGRYSESAWPCGVNNIAVGALHARHQW
ncbi:unnamed protein product, partial [Discosporangium mesarthrocarpum]